MKSHDWLSEHDLSLAFAPDGRMWKFRPTRPARGYRRVDAGIVDGTVVVTVTVTAIKPGDVDLSVEDNVLQIRGRSDRVMDLACDVGLPKAFHLDQLETEYADDTLAIRVLPSAKARRTTVGSVPVAV